MRILALLDPILPSAVRASLKGQFERFMKAEGIWNLGSRMARALLDQGQRPAGPQSGAGEPVAEANKLAELRNAAYEDAMGRWERSAEVRG